MSAATTDPPRLVDQLRREHLRREELEDRADWQRRLFANARLTPAERLTLFALREEFERKQPYRPDNLYGTHTPIHLYRAALADRAGLTEDAVSRALASLAGCGAVTASSTTQRGADGKVCSALYVGMTWQAIGHPEHLTPSSPKPAWGGKRPGAGRPRQCAHCQSMNLEQRTVTQTRCRDCGAVETVEEEAGPWRAVKGHGGPEPADDPAPTGIQDDFLPEEAPTGIQDDFRSTACQDGNATESSEATAAGGHEATPEDPAALLVALAGDGARHVRMVNDGPTAPKYVYDDGPVTLALAAAHAAGTVTLGASLKYADGTCRALCFDVDSLIAADQMRTAARRLRPYGYRPLMEWSPGYEIPSPGQQRQARRQGYVIDKGTSRGAHLWVLFDAPVCWEAAYAHVCRLSPTLAGIKEHWPQTGGQMVRLPCGLYHHPDGRPAERCDLQDLAVRDEGGYDVLDLAALPAALTPAAIVPPLPPADPPPPRPEPPKPPRPPSDDGTCPGSVIAAYNARTTVYDLVTVQRDGYFLAVWRGERTASVKVYDDGARWVDYGGGGMRGDGTHDGGDVFELRCRLESVHGKTKAEVCGEVAREMGR
jgi:hypothetical protein